MSDEIAAKIISLLGSPADAESAFKLFYKHGAPAMSGILCDTYLRLAVAENIIEDDDVAQCKEHLLEGTELDIKFHGSSENVEACKYVDGETTWAGCEVLGSKTELTMTIPAGDAEALAAACACLKHSFWNSSAPIEFDEESMGDESSEFLFLDKEGKRRTGQPESADGGAIDPEYSGDGDSVYYARNFGSDLEYEPWDNIPDLVAGVHCLWILALIAEVQWADLAKYDVSGHEAELEELIKSSFAYFS